MSVARIGELQAKEGLEAELRDFLVSIMPGIKTANGCESVQLYQSQSEPNQFMMIEVWDSVESHQASVKDIPPQKLGEIRPLLATSPSGGYFRLIEEA